MPAEPVNGCQHRWESTSARWNETDTVVVANCLFCGYRVFQAFRREGKVFRRLTVADFPLTQD